MIISKDLIRRIRDLANDEDLTHADLLRRPILAALDSLESGGGNDVVAWALYRACRDAVLGFGSVESVLAAARACSRSAALPHIQKEG